VIPAGSSPATQTRQENQGEVNHGFHRWHGYGLFIRAVCEICGFVSLMKISTPRKEFDRWYCDFVLQLPTAR
jgi:hypothetical protein